MSEFKQEHRYWVVKRKGLTPEQDEQCRQLCGRLRYEGVVPETEAVVVEADWPIYEETWENVQRVSEGRLSIKDELVEERDEYKRAYLSEQDMRMVMQGEVNRVEDEHDALAAHVERLRGIIENITTPGFASEALRNAPATSLARRDAQKQAEELERLFIEGQTGPNWIAEIPARIRELRRQAAGDAT